MNDFIASNTLFVTLATTGVILWLIGLYVQEYPPKKINKIYGYRTRRSMKTQEAWDFAQDYSIDLMIKAAKAICLLAVGALFVKIEAETGAILGTVMIIVAVIIPFVYTERELKRRFDE